MLCDAHGRRVERKWDGMGWEWLVILCSIVTGKWDRNGREWGQDIPVDEG